MFGIAEYVREEVAFVQVYVFGCSEKTTRFHKIMGLDMGPWLVLYFICNYSGMLIGPPVAILCFLAGK